MHRAIFKVREVPTYLFDEGVAASRLAGFSQFLNLRWNASLPKGKGLTLLPVCASRDFFSRFNRDLVKLLNLCRSRVRVWALADPHTAVKELFGPGEFPVDLLQREISKSRRAFPLVARPDVVILQDGTAKILETNIGSGFAGLFWCEQLHGFYHSEPHLKKWLKEQGLKMPAPTLGPASLSDFLKVKNLAIIDTGLPYMFSQAMAEYMNRYRKSGKTFYSLHSELDIGKTGVYVDGHKVDWIYPNLLPHYFPVPYLRNIWRAVDSGALRSFSGLWDTLASSKAALALIYRDASLGMLSIPETRLVNSFIPPTYVMKDQIIKDGASTKDIWRFCIERQNHLVAKRACGEQAKGLLIGRFTPRGDWERFIQERAKDPSDVWVVQYYIEHPEETNFFLSEDASVRKFVAPFHVCPFVFGKVASLGVRFGFDTKQERPMVAPEDASCSINILALEPN